MHHRTVAVTLSLLVAVAATLPAARAGWQDWVKKAEEAVGGATGGATDPAAASLTRDEMARGLKEALEVGIQRAIDYLGQEGGFLNDPEVRIPMPQPLKPVESTLRRLGQDDLADRFVETMNHAAERAVPETLGIFKDAVGDMSLEDARGILNGPDDAATSYLRRTSGERIQQAIRPIVEDATAKAGVTSAYKQMVGQVGGMLGGMVDTESLSLDRHVTEEATEGLFLKLAEEEKRIREDPVARTTDILKKVFGN